MQSAAAFSKLYQRIWKKAHQAQTKVKTYRIRVLKHGIEKNDFRKLDGLQYQQLKTITGKTFRDKIFHKH